MTQKRVALVGAGSMANSVHYPSLAECDDVELVGICDLNEERLEATADRFHIDRRFTAYRQMLEATNPEAVYVLMPPHQLFDIVIHCLNEKLHVFIEKPPGVTTYQVRAMAVTAERNDCLSMVGFNRRYIPLVTQAYERVSERGPLSQCVATFYKNHVGKEMYYKGAADILHCDAVHAVDALRWMAGGEAVNVTSSVRSLYEAFDTCWLALVRFDTGCVGVLLTNWTAGTRIHTFEMHSKGISAFVDPDGSAELYADGHTDPVWTQSAAGAAGTDARHKTYGFFQESRHFIDRLESGEQPMTNFADAAKTMELCDLIERETM